MIAISPGTSPARRDTSPMISRVLLATVSLAAISLGIGLPGSAKAAPLQSMVAMQAGRVVLPDGSVSQWSGASLPKVGTAADGRPLMTIQQTKQKALLDWEKFQLQTDEILEFQQQSADWIAVNRVHGADAARIDGEIRAPGRVFIFNDNGVLIGKDAKINVRQLVTGAGVSDVDVDGRITTLAQSKSKAIINWSDMSSQAGDVLRIQQEKKDWIALNRSLAQKTTVLNGNIEASGEIYLVAPEGLEINGSVKAQQVIASALNIRDQQFTAGLTAFIGDYNNRQDPIFSNSWNYKGYFGGSTYADLLTPPPPIDDPNDPSRYKLTIGRNGSIETASYGKVMLFGPAVTNKGLVSVKDEGQVILAAGDNIYFSGGDGRNVNVVVGAYNPISFMRVGISYMGMSYIGSQEQVDFWKATYGLDLKIGDSLPDAGARYEAYLNKVQFDRIKDVGFHARNEGIIRAARGGSVDFRGINLEQMGAIEMTSTALFRGSINFFTTAYDLNDYYNGPQNGPAAPGNGDVVFGKNSLTQITPDLDSTDTIPLSSGAQSVGSIKINAARVHMQEDSIIHMPSGAMSVLLDDGGNIFDNNRGAGANQNNESGTRFLMDRGATIDLSGWSDTVLAMGYHQVTGKLYAAQLADSPLQRDGPFYRKEITVDRRYGTDLADWATFDNLNQGTLAQFLINGGSFKMDVDDDFIMKPGSVIDVSGGKVTYTAGYVNTTLVRTLDNRVIDIREADPDLLYMGFADEYVVTDQKWRQQKTYYIPFMSSMVGRYEEGYVEGGNAGSVEIIAPDTVLQGTLLGGTTIGKYQRANLPKGGSFSLNNVGESEGEYASNNVLISAIEMALPDDFGIDTKLSDTYGDLFGVEFDPETQERGTSGRTSDNTTLLSADMLNRSTMGSYYIRQQGRVADFPPPFPALPGTAVTVEHGANIALQNGGSLTIAAGERVQFLGSFRSEGGSFSLSGLSLVFAPDSKIDTRGSWYNDMPDKKTGAVDPAALALVPRINGGSISLSGFNDGEGAVDDASFILPDTMVIDSSGGGWVDVDGKLKLGKGGNLAIGVAYRPEDTVDLSGLNHARAYGLGGNGAYSLATNRPIYIGEAAPEPEEGQAPPMVLAPEFFERSGFSKITLTVPSVTVGKGVTVDAQSASLQLKGDALDAVGDNYLGYASGSDIYDVADITLTPIEQRSAALRRGMDLAITGFTVLEKGSRLAVEAGGTISTSSASIAGTLQAPGGKIDIGGDANGRIDILSTGRLLAPGAVLITSRTVSPGGRDLVDGTVLDGGTIALHADTITIADGAVLDVSGASAMLDLPVTGQAGAVTRQPTLVGSNGGTISIGGKSLMVDEGSYRAFAGAPTAHGGRFDIGWSADYGVPGGPVGPSPQDIYYSFSYLFDYGYISDKQGNQLTSFFNTDLSNVDWLGQFGLDLQFAPGFKVASYDAFVNLLTRYNQGATGAPPMFLVGNNLKAPTPVAADPVAIDPGLRGFLEVFGYVFPTAPTGPVQVTTLSVDRIAAGGFSSLGISSSPAMIFSGDVTVGGRKANGDYVFDRIDLTTPYISGRQGANVKLEAGIVTLSATGGGQVDAAAYRNALLFNGVSPDNQNTRITIASGPLMQVEGANFLGFSETHLQSDGDIRLIAPFTNTPNQPGTSGLYSAGLLTLKADQIYANTGARFTISSDKAIEILPQDAGTPINETPYEAAAVLTLRAPRITQGGTLRSPLGTINIEAIDDGSAGAGVLTLKPGSLTSVNADGHVIPYGFLQNGDTWIDPITGLELRTLPDKAINLKGDKIDLQENAVLDVAGSGDLYAREFVPGLGGSTDWLAGYRNQNYDWVADSGQIFAVLPESSSDIAPYGLSGTNVGVGDKIYLSGGSGLKAGYYTLLPAAYAALPGAYRVTAQHHYAGDYSNMPLGQVTQLADGSTIQAGYRYTSGSTIRDPRNTGFLVMNGDTLRLRSHYEEARASGFFVSPAFLKKALRTNRPIADIPRIPIDGGSVVIEAGSELNLDATLKSKAAEGGRGGFADIKAGKIAVVSAGTDTSKYDGYLLLDSDRLNGFGAESLLLGGVRRQGEVNLELAIGATDIVVDNKGSVLSGPEILLAASNHILIKDGAAIETKGTISGSSGDLRVLPAIAAIANDMGTPYPDDDVRIHGVLDQGAVLRLSSGEQVDILRNINAIDSLNAILADPVQLASINAQRTAKGLAPLAAGGDLIISDGARLSSSRSLAMDATHSTTLAKTATLAARQISAASSRVSVGEVPAGAEGLVFAGGSLGALAASEDIALKSYSTIDFFGGATLHADNGLTLDAREFRMLAADGETVTVTGKTLTLANSSGGSATATAGNADLVLEGDNIYLSGGDKRVSGVRSVSIHAAQRVIGQDENTLYMPGMLTIQAGALTAESGSRLFFDAAGAVDIVSGDGTAALAPYKTFGATIGITGASVSSHGAIALTGGTVNLRARSGDVSLADGSSIDVTSAVSQIFDVAVGVGAGSVNLVSDSSDIRLAQDAAINVSGSAAGGDAGILTASAGLGAVTLGTGVKGNAQDGYRSGSFMLLSKALTDFGGLNAALDAGGFREARHFEFNTGDATIDGAITVRDFAVVANDGSINLTGTIRTPGDNGGRVQLSAAESVNLLATGQIIARANAADGSGGNVFLETVGRNGGRIDLAAGSLIDVSGTGEGGRLVRLRAPQIGNDMAVGTIAGTITGARSVVAEAFRVYEGVTTIDQAVINQVSADATTFMANAGALRGRLGGAVTVAPGIELRSNGDMELATDWDLHGLRFNGAAGVLTLRAKGDLLINANLSDGFDGSTPAAAMLNGQSWAFNLTAGANTTSPNSLAVLPIGQLADGKGSVIVGGTPDTIDYYYDPAHGNENRLYLKDPVTGRFVRDQTVQYHLGWVELTRNAAGQYVDPRTGKPIEKDPVTGDYVDTENYARRPLPWFYFDDGGGYEHILADGSLGGLDFGEPVLTAKRFIQFDNSTGYMVRTGTAGIDIASGRDLVLKYRPSVIYTAGERAPTLAGFYEPANSYYGVSGGDISIDAAGSILGSGSPQMPQDWLIRRVTIRPDGLFAEAADRLFDQSTWYVDFANFQAGIGALGGGNVDITAGGDILNLAVSVPTSGRVTGNTKPDEPMAVTQYGGGDLTMRAGGNIGSGKFYVGEGLGTITAGGAFISSDTVETPGFQGGGGGLDLYYYAWGPQNFNRSDIYTMLFTSSGELRLQSGGDLNIDAVMDPLLPNPNSAQGFVSYTPDAKVSLFSAGGDVTLWNNALNVDMEYQLGIYRNPTHVVGTTSYPYGGNAYVGWEVWPPKVSVVAASGDIRVLGGLLLAPAAQGSLDLLARGNVHIGTHTTNQDDFIFDPDFATRSNYRSGFEGIILSQAKPELFRTSYNPIFNNYNNGSIYRNMWLYAGPGSLYSEGGGITNFSREVPPDLHVGDTDPVRIYAADGDIVTSAGLTIPKSLWVQAGGNVYFPSYSIQHNNLTDLSIVRAGKGLYFDGNDFISIAGPGRLEIETGTDFWIPSNASGITSNQIVLPDENPYDTVPAEFFDPERKAADIAISVGYNRRPDYEGFDGAYLTPGEGQQLADFLLQDAGDGRKLSIYLFDRLYARGDREPTTEFMSPELREGFVNWVRQQQGLPALESEQERNDYLTKAWDYWVKLPAGQKTPYDSFFPKGAAAAAGADPAFYLPEERQGLVNYVRGLQGLAKLETQDEQLAYLDTALAYWNGLTDDYKTPLYREILNMELRTTGREANAKDNPRYNSTFRGYNAIATLYPGAEKRETEALGDGESRWQGDFETYASRVMSFGGGSIDVMAPGGALKLANIAARPEETGQPPAFNNRGEAKRAGLVSVNGGEINVFTHDSVTVNQSRILTAKGGNIFIWSSYGDIAAGAGAKTSITPTFYDYTLDNYYLMNRTPAGLPSGAGIGTVASVPGAPVADVDLIAPNGIVDAGDAGIRVSGNFNVFAVQILGTDNIDVAGIATGLPLPPAAPPIQMDNLSAKSGDVQEAIKSAIEGVRKNGTVATPSLIEVRVTGFGEDGCQDNCTPPPERGPMSGGDRPAPATPGGVQPVSYAMNTVTFNLPSQPVSDAIQAVGRQSGVSIIYDSKAVADRTTAPVRGRMSTDDALRQLLRDTDVTFEHVSPNTILLRPRAATGRN